MYLGIIVTLRHLNSTIYAASIGRKSRNHYATDRNRSLITVLVGHVVRPYVFLGLR
jgi:hypothetical protein